MSALRTRSVTHESGAESRKGVGWWRNPSQDAASHRAKTLRTPADAYATGEIDTEADPAAGETDSSARRLADCDALRRETGWCWDVSELSHFLTRPKSFAPEAALWRRKLTAAARTETYGLLAHLKGAEPSGIRSQLDECLARLREVARILAVLYPQADPRTPQETELCRGEPDAGGWDALARMELFEPLGVRLSGLQPEQRREAWQLVPPTMQALLRARLGQHAQDICRADSPECGRCEIARFCRAERSRRLAAAASSRKPIVVDLFCGAGGISLGFSRAGFRPVLAVDANPEACTTYRLNHHDISEDAVLCADIRELAVAEITARLGGRPLDVLIGAPPCQGFSLAGLRSKQALAARQTLAGYCISEDERNYLFQYVVGAAVALRPRLVLMENVPGMDSPRGTEPSFMRAAEQMLRDAGFLTAIWKLDAAAYGVPQRRVRSLLVASSVGRLPAVPEAEFQHGASRSFDPDALPPVTVEAAIFDLPPVEADSGAAVMLAPVMAADSDPRHRYYLRNRRFPIKGASSLVFNHRCRYHNPQDLELYGLLRPGEDSVHVIERHGRGDLMRYRRDVFDDKYARLRPDQPSKTIVSHLAKDGNSYVHPTQTRSITHREAARLQSYPDDFVFCGSPSEQWIQIGNSVPPALAAAIARSFRDLLAREPRP